MNPLFTSPPTERSLPIRLQAAALVALTAMMLYAAPLWAADPAPAEVAATPAPAPAQGIEISDVAVQAESVLTQLQKFQTEDKTDSLIKTTAEQIPDLSDEVMLTSAESRQLVKQNAMLQSIKTMEDEAVNLKLQADRITDELTTAAVKLDKDIEQIDGLDAQWQATAAHARDSAAPQEVLNRIREINTALALAKKDLLDKRSQVLTFQSKTADLSARASEAQQSLDEAKARAVKQLLAKDSPAIWSSDFWSASADSFSAASGSKMGSKLAIVIDYIATHQAQFISHAVFYLVLCILLLGIRSKVRNLGKTDPELQKHQRVFDKPWLSALLIALLASTWFYQRPPREFWIVVGLLSALPIVLLARYVMERSLHAILYAVVFLYLIDKIRAITGGVPMISRLIFLTTALLAVAFGLWLLRRSQPGAKAPAWSKAPIWRLIRIATWIGLGVVAVAFVCNVTGHVRLSELIGNTAIASAYMAIFLYALTRIGEGLIQGISYVWPISSLGMVKHHKALITERINGWLIWLAFLYWAYLTLRSLDLYQWLVDHVVAILGSSLHMGSLVLSIGDVAAFFFMIWAANVVSKFLRFVLQEEMFPKMRLARGMPYAVLTIVHYLIIVTGMVLALGALGIDMTKFTILAGAFSVGVGFGLQNIVNNFVSGLILLFERPIEVGDTIEIDTITGRITRIGIRASIVLSNTGAEVIIPNGRLISDKVTNWTLSGSQREIKMLFSTKAGVDSEALKQLMLDTAKANPDVADSPPPQALFTRRGFDSYDFELSVWTDALNGRGKVRSDLMSAVNAVLYQQQVAAEAKAGS